ncbi:MAG TPA: outer membrane protein assembly factor BamD [Polyangiaceae bacterium]
MSDPRRLRETGCSDLERALLDVGSVSPDSTHARVKTLAALGLAGTAALSAGAASASSPWLLRLGLSKLQVVVSMASAATALSVGVFVWEQHRVAQGKADTQAVAQVAAPAKPLALVRPDAPDNVPSPATDAPSDAAPNLVPAHRKSDRRDSAPLAAELEALDAARAALSRGDAGGALSRLDAYARAYPAGRLVLEAEVLRIDALSRSGQTTQARQRAEAFLRRYPNSVLAPRVRSYVGG